MKKITINSSVIRHIADLSKITLSQDQEKSYAESLGAIFNYMERMAALKLHEVPTTARVTEEENILREDKVEPSLTQKEALANALRIHKGFFVVDYVLKNKDL